MSPATERAPANSILLVLLGFGFLAWVLWSMFRRRGPERLRPPFADLAEDEVDSHAECPEKLLDFLLALAKKLEATPPELAQAALRMVELEKPQEATELAKLALASERTAEGVLYPSARALLAVKEIRLARDTLEEAMTRRGLEPHEDLLYAEVLQADQAPETAVEVLRRTCERVPTSFEAHWKLGRALLELDRPEDALPILVRAGNLRASSPLSFPGIGGEMTTPVLDSEFLADLEEAQERLREEGKEDEEE